VKKRRSGIGAKAGKQPQKNIRTGLTESKYESGGAGMKRKKGGIVRRPKAPIRYKHKKSVA
jgi:hypothetical protein